VQKRTLLATATLTALLLSPGTMQTAPTGVEAEPARHALGPQTMQSAEAAADPQWGAAFGLGFKFGVLSAVACAGFMGPGAIACGIAGAA